MTTTGRLRGDVPATGEAFHPLATLGGAVRVEHIVSSAQPDPGVQRQDWDEWVLMLSGAAAVRVWHGPGADAYDDVGLRAGDWLLLPAGTPHAVLRTEAGTQWVAVHGPPGQPSSTGSPQPW